MLNSGSSRSFAPGQKTARWAFFSGLWGSTLVILGLERCMLLAPYEALPEEEDAILLRLNSHLEALSQGFGVTEPIAQLPLFPAIGLRRSEAANGEAEPLPVRVEGGRS
jgi:hypothetical protein